MKFTRNASAHWEGSGKDGKGTVSTESGVLNKTAYNFSKRFEDENGTNPEELIGAAHAACFTMQLSFLLGEEGFTAAKLDTKADVSFKDGAIVYIALSLTGVVPEIDEQTFQKIAKEAKEVCPVSKLLQTEITLTSSLSK